jgi:hypothetical protein
MSQRALCLPCSQARIVLRKAGAGPDELGPAEPLGSLGPQVCAGVGGGEGVCAGDEGDCAGFLSLAFLQQPSMGRH